MYLYLSLHTGINPRFFLRWIRPDDRRNQRIRAAAGTFWKSRGGGATLGSSSSASRGRSPATSGKPRLFYSLQVVAVVVLETCRGRLEEKSRVTKTCGFAFDAFGALSSVSSVNSLQFVALILVECALSSLYSDHIFSLTELWDKRTVGFLLLVKDFCVQP